MTSLPEITNTSQELAAGKRYLLYFRYSPLTPEIARKLSDEANIRAAFVNKFGNAADVQLEGTTITQTGEFIALVQIKGTPLLAAIAPVVAIVLLITAGVVALTFIKAVLVNVGGGLSDALRDVGQGLKGIGEGAGAGLQFGLPALGVTAGIALLFVLFGAISLSRLRG